MEPNPNPNPNPKVQSLSLDGESPLKRIGGHVSTVRSLTDGEEKREWLALDGGGEVDISMIMKVKS